jgi:hypothetical protein
MSEPTHDDQSKRLAGEKRSAVGSYRIFQRWRPLKLVIVAALALFALLAVISGLVQKGLWMGQLGYSGIFEGVKRTV